MAPNCYCLAKCINIDKDDNITIIGLTTMVIISLM